MTLPTLPPPSAAAPRRASPPAPARRPLFRHVTGAPRVRLLTGRGVGASLVLHLVFLVLLALGWRLEMRRAARPAPAPTPGERVEYYDLAYSPGAGGGAPLAAPAAGAVGGGTATPADTAAAAPLVAPRTVPRGIPAAPAVPGAGGGAGVPGAGGAGGAGAGAPGAGGGGLGGGLFGDPRLAITPREVPPPPPPTDHERYMAHLERRLRSLNDSTFAEEEAARRATDWTARDKDGKRWGVSPGKLHLGDVTLPLPVTFSPPPAKRDEADQRARQRGEIQRQGDDYERDRAREEAIRRTRARKDAEREQKRRQEPPPPPQPDTARSR